MTISEYDIRPLGYLKRAGQQLKSDTLQSLFYAALELRCAIEARAREQLFSLKRIPPKTIKLWHAEKIMAELNKMVKGAMTPMTIRIRMKSSKQKIDPFTYKPIDKRILSEYGKLGDLLHAPKNKLTEEDIKKRKKNLWIVMEEVDKRCRGHMLHPPEWKIPCTKCGKYLPINEWIETKDLSFICKCGHKNSLRGKKLIITMRAIKKSAKSVALVQAEQIEESLNKDIRKVKAFPN